MRIHSRLVLAFFFLFLSAYNTSALPLGSWKVFDVQETKVGNNGLVVPLIILESQEPSSIRPNKIANAKTLLPQGKRLFLVVRLKQSHKTDLMVMVEGNVGIVVSNTNTAMAQSIWPNETITTISDDEFTNILNNTDNVEALVNKSGSEPTNTLNGSRYFDFEKDLKVLKESSDWRSVSDFLIERAYHQIPSQSIRPEKSWGCGPNSGARALVMLGGRIVNFDSFVKKCPKSWSLFADVGPTPTQLADYLQKGDLSRTIEPKFDNYFSGVLRDIKLSINENRPLIVLLVRSTFSMHYINVIGYNDAEQKIAILDTTKILYWLTYDDLEHWMNAAGHFLKLFYINDFNTIIFGQKNRGRSHDNQ